MSSPQHPTPPIIQTKNATIGFIVHRSFDSLNIQPVIGTVISAFKRNEDNNPTFIFYSNDKVVNFQFVDALNAWHIDQNHYAFLQDPSRDYANGEYDDNHAVNSHIRNYKAWHGTGLSCHHHYNCGNCCDQCSGEVRLMLKYKEMIEVYKCDAIYIFTDNHRANEIRSLVNDAKMHKEKHISIITVDSNGDFMDLTNPNNPKNFRTLYGRYGNGEQYTVANQNSFGQKAWRSKNWTAEGSNNR